MPLEIFLSVFAGCFFTILFILVENTLRRGWKLRHEQWRPNAVQFWRRSVGKPTSPISKWFTKLRYLLAGPHIIQEAYIQAQGKPFLIPTPSNNHLLITSKELIKEVLEAPPQLLSLHAVAKELLQPRYTMSGFEWQDQRGLEGTGFVRALRSRLTSHLPTFKPDLEKIIQLHLEKELSSPEIDDFAQVKIFPMVKRLITRTNCFVFFGDELSQIDEFVTAALEFPQVIILAAEIIRITPRFLHTIVTLLVTRNNRAAKTLTRYLRPVVEKRLAIRLNSSHKSNSVASSIDCMQWLIDTSPRKEPWSPDRAIGEILSIWFSSIHQLAMVTTFAIQDLCLHDEYVEPMRRELLEGSSNGDLTLSDLEALPLLDSFLKESVRFTNSDAITCRRKALKRYTLQDGSIISQGDWVCIPQRAMLCDENRYSNPHTFDGFRFARANASLRHGHATREIPDTIPSSLTSTNVEWPVWGLGNTACPGRFYASLVLKLIIRQILVGWDCTMPNLTSSRTMTWRSSVVPREDKIVAFRRKPVVAVPLN